MNTTIPNTTFGTLTLLAILVGIKSGNLAFDGTDENGDITITPTTRASKRQAREDKAKRFADIKALVLEQLETERPLKIGPILKNVEAKLGYANDKDGKLQARLETSQALRELREAGTLSSSNSTQSNFHMEWTLTAKPEQFPVPVPVEPVVKAPKAKKEKAAKADKVEPKTKAAKGAGKGKGAKAPAEAEVKADPFPTLDEALTSVTEDEAIARLNAAEERQELAEKEEQDAADSKLAA